jgi:hypothetical protein
LALPTQEGQVPAPHRRTDQQASQEQASADGFAIKCALAYIFVMLKPVDLPPEVACAFVRDMRAFHAEKNGVKADGIAARQLHALKAHYKGKLKLHDVRAMFYQMRDEV